MTAMTSKLKKAPSTPKQKPEQPAAPAKTQKDTPVLVKPSVKTPVIKAVTFARKKVSQRKPTQGQLRDLERKALHTGSFDYLTTLGGQDEVHHSVQVYAAIDWLPLIEREDPLVCQKYVVGEHAHDDPFNVSPDDQQLYNYKTLGAFTELDNAVLFCNILRLTRLQKGWR